MEMWELVARESIRDLVARYNSNADTARFGPVLKLFAPDAVMELPDGLYEGIAGIERVFTGTQQTVKSLAAPGGTTHLRHYTSTLQIDLVDTTHATSRCYYQVLMPHGLDHWGRYIDEYRVQEGSWRFSRRKVTLDGYTPGGMGAATVAATSP
jgi:hypothetical protein